MAKETNNNTEEMQDELTLEESFARLDELLGDMERQGVSLEDSFRLYEQGMKLVGRMQERLQELSGRIEKISADGRIEEFEDDI